MVDEDGVEMEDGKTASREVLYSTFGSENNGHSSTSLSFTAKPKQLVQNDHAPKRISHLQFGLLSPAEMQRLAEFKVTSRELFTISRRSTITPTAASSAVTVKPEGTDANSNNNTVTTGQSPVTPPVQTHPQQQHYTASRIPATGGCLDPRLGVSDKVSTCQTCKLKLVDCAGHYGYIALALPVFHIGFLRHTVHILQCICKTCSRVLLSPDVSAGASEEGDDHEEDPTNSDRERHYAKMTDPTTDALTKSVWFKKCVEKCKKVRICPYCKNYNGTVKKLAGAPTLKILHERYTHPTASSASQSSTSQRPKSTRTGGRAAMLAEQGLESLKQSLETAAKYNKDIEAMIETDDNGTSSNFGPVEDLLPTRVLDLFSHITDEDCEILWIDPTIGRPENLILQNLLVPPVPIRPSVAMDVGGGSNEDDLTVKLQEILDVNVALELALSKGPLTRTIMEEWDFLQVQVAQYINGEMPGLQRPIGAKPMRGLCQRLKGKQGRFRGNLSGKRVDFSARTVISPDPNLCVDQVGVPRRVAMTMTYPERVSKYNLAKLQERVRNGPDKYPGANLIRMRDGSFVRSLAFGNRNVSAQSLRYGDVVERHMEDDDIVLFNRQPSLHKVSIMAHRVKVMDWKTFRFNTCVCAPYNADFDGDEMNMHLPQREEARAEASLLMGVKQNLITPRNGEPLVAASQDFLSAAYLLTQRDQFFTREHFCQLVSYFGDANEHIDLPLPAIIKPVELWTGKQVFAMLLVPNKESKLIVNFETREKNYVDNKHFDKNDGWVAFRNSELISGNVAKKTIGDGSKTGLLYVLLRDCGTEAAAQSMNRWAKFCARYLGGHRGLSIGISDVTPSEELRNIKSQILQEGYRKVRVRSTDKTGKTVLLSTSLFAN